eukprot:CAMPEP_0170197020 /NCGR_PEP_ID=MMETSP0040_2-20121228/65373_1 /TAXON_ID=641309 /ORGANISM="Lotharella oceanica, Strain CCMP622" /LENGTH=47 /DNA_ID= /DNA_START= /DNA_END= /DNA_ORIENTATION=
MQGIENDHEIGLTSSSGRLRRASGCASGMLCAALAMPRGSSLACMAG